MGQSGPRHAQGIIGRTAEYFTDPPQGRRGNPRKVVEGVAARARLKFGQLSGCEGRKGIGRPAKVGDVGGASDFSEIGKLPQGCGVR
jgi:hypothetical protein